MQPMLKLLPVLVAVMLALPAQASVLTLSYVAHQDGSLSFVDGNVGDAVAVGDTVHFQVTTEDGFALYSTPGNYVWAVAGMSGSGTRTGDFTWQFSNHGQVLASGADTEQNAFVHFGPYAITSFSGQFDAFEWTGVMTASTTGDNVLDGWQFLATNATWADDISTRHLPEPASVTLLGLGAASLALARRRARRRG